MNKDQISKEVLKYPLENGYLSPEEAQKNRKAVYYCVIRFPKKATRTAKRQVKILYLYCVFSTTIASGITTVLAVGLPAPSFIDRLQSNPFQGKSIYYQNRIQYAKVIGSKADKITYKLNDNGFESPFWSSKMTPSADSEKRLSHHQDVMNELRGGVTLTEIAWLIILYLDWGLSQQSSNVEGFPPIKPPNHQLVPDSNSRPPYPGGYGSYSQPNSNGETNLRLTPGDEGNFSKLTVVC